MRRQPGAPARRGGVVQSGRAQPAALGTRKLHHMLQQPLQQAKASSRARRTVRRAADASMLVHRCGRITRPPTAITAPPPPQSAQAGSRGRCVPPASEQVWVADITYLPTRNEIVYLSLVTDACSRKIVGWHVHDSLHTDAGQPGNEDGAARRQTISRWYTTRTGASSIARTTTRSIHRRHGIRCSMTDGYDCYQNALAQRVNGILKMEFLLQAPADLEPGKRMVQRSVAHLQPGDDPTICLKYKTPDECTGRLWLAGNQAGNMVPTRCQPRAGRVREPGSVVQPVLELVRVLFLVGEDFLEHAARGRVLVADQA